MGSLRFLKPDATSSQNLALAALDFTTTITKACSLTDILLHASVAITEDITITLDSAKGANYDVVLRRSSLVAEQDFFYKPEGGKMDLQAGDQIRVQCTNANTTGTVYVAIKNSELGG